LEKEGLFKRRRNRRRKERREGKVRKARIFFTKGFTEGNL